MTACVKCVDYNGLVLRRWNDTPKLTKLETLKLVDYVHIWGEVEDELATEEDITEAVENMDENMPIITDINTHMKSPFEEIWIKFFIKKTIIFETQKFEIYSQRKKKKIFLPI